MPRTLCNHQDSWHLLRSPHDRDGPRDGGLRSIAPRRTAPKHLPVRASKSLRRWPASSDDAGALPPPGPPGDSSQHGRGGDAHPADNDTDSTAIRVLVVDDNEYVGQALRARLGRELDMRWVGFLTSADTLVDAVATLKPDVVLLDIDMPGRSSFDALTDLTALHPQSRVVMLSGHVRRELIDRAFGAGAWGYVSKNDDLTEIIGAVRRVLGGTLVMSTEVTAILEA